MFERYARLAVIFLAGDVINAFASVEADVALDAAPGAGSHDLQAIERYPARRVTNARRTRQHKARQHRRHGQPPCLLRLLICEP